jgi:uncharacterized membrane protein YdjX (TVP38/TMEM64 family)
MRRPVAWAIVAVLLIGIAAVSFAFRDAFEPARLQAALSHTPWAPAIFILAHLVVSLAFIPRTFMALAAGALFGFWYGTALALIGGMVGGTVAFMLVRYLHRGIFALEGKRGHAWVEALKQRLDDGGWRGVAMVRLVPAIPHTAGNYAFGLTSVSLVDYCIGSFIGLLPSTIVFVAVGAAGAEALSGSADALWLSLAAAAALAASFALPRLLRWLRKR